MKKRVELTAEQIAILREMHADKCSQKAIAIAIGMTRDIVNRVYKELGLEPLPNGKVRNDPVLMKQILDLYNRGDMSNNAIGKQLGKPHSTICRILSGLGITDFKFANNPLTLTPGQETRFLELRAKGWGVPSLVKELSTNKRALYRYMDEHNISRTPPPKIREPKTHKICTICKEDRDICHFQIKYKETTSGTVELYSYCCNDCHRLRKNISNSIRIHLLDLSNRGAASEKIGSCLDFLPYSILELKQHIEAQFKLPGNEWMSWGNWGQYIIEKWDDNDKSTWMWHLDHIIPHCSFPYTSMSDPLFVECWALSNLRPYSAKQNIIDNDKGYRVGDIDRHTSTLDNLLASD